MSLYQDWRDDITAHSNDPYEQQKYWDNFCEAEMHVYEKILGDNRQVVEGTVESLRDEFGLDNIKILGFIDGISESLNEDLGDLNELTLETPVKLDINFEKLYTNMLKVPAEWLYTLPQWDSVLSEEKRHDLTRAYKDSKTVHVEKIGRNDPCPCGSGKKYKKCCGKNKNIRG